MKFKNIFSRTAIAGLAGSLMISGCGIKQPDKYDDKTNNSVIINDLAYNVLSEEYYTDENNELHRVSKIPQIQIKKVNIIKYPI